jgi:hypothetical protein
MASNSENAVLLEAAVAGIPRVAQAIAAIPAKDTRQINCFDLAR